MVWATIADTLKDFGALCAALAAIAGTVALVFKLRPVRWVFRKLIVDPLAGWFRGMVREEMDRKNGGSTLKDTVDTLVELRAADHKQLMEIKTALGIGEDEPQRSQLYGLGEGK